MTWNESIWDSTIRHLPVKLFLNTTWFLYHLNDLHLRKVSDVFIFCLSFDKCSNVLFSRQTTFQCQQQYDTRLKPLKCCSSDFIIYFKRFSTQWVNFFQTLHHRSWRRIWIHLGINSVHFLKYRHFHDGGAYHIETSPLIWSVNQWTGFYMLEISVMKELIKILKNCLSLPCIPNKFLQSFRTRKSPLPPTLLCLQDVNLK